MQRRKLAPAILAALVTVLVASCATAPTETGATAPTTTPGTADPGILLGVAEVAESYPTPENVPYDYLGLQHAEWLSFCTRAFGFESTIVTVPGAAPTIFASVTDAQRLRWVEVNEMCTDEAVARGWVTPLPTSAEELRAEYQRLLQVNECLTELGYGTDAPSEARYLEEQEWNVYANTPIGGQLVVSPGALNDMPASVRQQLEIQEACSTPTK